MKKLVALTLILVFALTAMSLNRATDPDDPNCTILHNGTFIYADEQGEPVRVVINGKNHTEYHKGGKYYIKSQLNWDNDCEYTAKIVKANLPGFPYKKGTKMKVIIDNVDGNAIFCTGIIDEQSFSSKLVKMDK